MRLSGFSTTSQLDLALPILAKTSVRNILRTDRLNARGINDAWRCFCTLFFLICSVAVCDAKSDLKLPQGVTVYGDVTVLRPIEVLNRTTTDCRNGGDDYDIFRLAVARSSNETKIEINLSGDLKSLGCEQFRLGKNRPKKSTFLIGRNNKLSQATSLNFKDEAVRRAWTLVGPLPYQKTNLAENEMRLTNVALRKFGADECWPIGDTFEVVMPDRTKRPYLFIAISENGAKLGSNTLQYKITCNNWEGGYGFASDISSVNAQFYNLPQSAFIFDQTFGFGFLVNHFEQTFCLSVPDIKLRYLLTDRDSFLKMIPDERDQAALLGGPAAPKFPAIDEINTKIAHRIISMTKSCRTWSP